MRLNAKLRKNLWWMAAIAAIILYLALMPKVM
jgi:hypothetical protein